MLGHLKFQLRVILQKLQVCPHVAAAGTEPPLHSWLANFTAGHDDKSIIRKMKLRFLIAFLGNERYHTF